MAQLTRTNPNALQTLAFNMKQLDKYDLKVGWFETSHYPDGTPVAYIAAIQEFGWKFIPPRLPVRATANAKISEWLELAGQGAVAIMSGKETVERVIDLLGLKIQGDISKAIAQVKSPPLSKITLMARKYREEGKKVTGKTIGEIAALIAAGKGEFSSNTKPLDETGLLSATLTYVKEKSK